MRFFLFLRNILRKIISSKQNIFSFDIENQKKYIQSLQNPKSDMERSINQYKCQCFLRGNLYVFISNLAALIFIPPVLLISLLRGKLKKNKEKYYCYGVFLSDGVGKEIFPDELIGKKIVELSYERKVILKWKDLKWIFSKYRKRPYSFYFIFKLILKVGIYRSIFEEYEIKSLITYTEFSFLSSIMTEYCNYNNIYHENIMHGEKLYCIENSFCRFNNYYVWDEHYKNLGIELKMESEQFKISRPTYHSSNIKKEFDYKYYLANETEEELLKIKNIIELLNNKSKKIKVRPHPRYTDKDLVYKLFDKKYIENTEEIDILTSIQESESVISLFSTVLNQAYYMDIDIIIDDVSNEFKYKKLKNLKYFMLDKKKYKVSDIVK